MSADNDGVCVCLCCCVSDFLFANILLLPLDSFVMDLSGRFSRRNTFKFQISWNTAAFSWRGTVGW